MPAASSQPVDPAQMFGLLRSGAENLGQAADRRLARLTDLAPLLAGDFTA